MNPGALHESWGNTEEEMLNRFQASRKPRFADITLESKWSD